MLLIMIAPLALLIGRVLGGRTTDLAKYTITLGWLAPLLFAAQWFLVHGPVSLNIQLVGACMIISTALLAYLFFRNAALPGFKLLLVGVLLNLLVMFANGGLMPITPDKFTVTGVDLSAASPGMRPAVSKNIVLNSEQAHLGWLGDTISLPKPLNFVVSPGDLAVAAGVGWFVLAGMQPRPFGKRYRSNFA